jgi:hypothetical protein
MKRLKLFLLKLMYSNVRKRIFWLQVQIKLVTSLENGRSWLPVFDLENTLIVSN